MSDKSPQSEKSLSTLGPLTTPLSLRGWPTWLVYLMAFIGLVYIFNPTAGLLEIIPDNFPIVGNLDDGVAFLLVWTGLVEFFEGRKLKKTAMSTKKPQDKINIPPAAPVEVIEGEIIEEGQKKRKK